MDLIDFMDLIDLIDFMDLRLVLFDTRPKNMLELIQPKRGFFCCKTNIWAEITITTFHKINHWK